MANTFLRVKTLLRPRVSTLLRRWDLPRRNRRMAVKLTISTPLARRRAATCLKVCVTITPEANDFSTTSFDERHKDNAKSQMAVRMSL